MQVYPNQNSFLVGNFIKVQRDSFYSFLEKGLIQEFAKKNPIKNSVTGLTISFYSEYYRLTRPDFTSKDSILKSKSYSSEIYVPVQVTNRSKKILLTQWLLIGCLPLMTKRGHFILNGSPRVVVNQLVRSPGIYYHEEVNSKKIRTFYLDFIPFRGTWLRLEIDKKNKVWARMKRTQKISILLFLQALGYNLQTIEKEVTLSPLLTKSFVTNHPWTSEEATKRILIDMRQERIKKQARLEKIDRKHPLVQQALKSIESQTNREVTHNFFYNKLGNPRAYQLGKVGRFRINEKLRNKIPLMVTFLTPSDILLATNQLLEKFVRFEKGDDIDNLKNRRVRTSGELIQIQWEKGLFRLESLLRKSFKLKKKKVELFKIITTKPVNGVFREFFGSSPLSQYMDQTNPLAEITHKRRVSFLGPGGVNRESASIAVRGIHPTYYGRICPIETPEGRNAGLVNSLTIYAQVNTTGFIETPFYKVCQGQIHHPIPFYFSAEKEELVKVAPGDLQSSPLHFLNTTSIPIKLSTNFEKVFSKRVEFIGVSPLQMISVATSLIPFLEHDDANRALMGSNMQRQALPLLFPERPEIKTGLEGRAVADSGHVLEALESGYVSYVSSKKIKILRMLPL
jgi:DNA-directed RNA polymerase subunit beta